MTTHIGDKLKNRYEILEVVGQGEHGKTWKARDDQSAPPRFCIIKQPLGSHQAIRELEAESAAAGLLHHKNIVPVLEFNANDGFLVEEFVAGLSLQAKLRQDAREKTWPSIEESTTILKQCLEGLEYAHEKGRIHGDIKPGNIMLQDNGEARLTDFGVSRFVVGTNVSGGAPWDPSRFGSATYSAPEVLLNRSWSVQSDLFSAGMIGYLLFGRRHPFIDESGLWTTRERLLDPDVAPPAIATLNAALDTRVERVVSKLLERDPIRRYRSAREALDELIGTKPLTNLCSHCGAENPAPAKYCNECGRAIFLPATSESGPDQQLSLSYSLFQAGDREQALAVVEKLLSANPDLSKAWAHKSFLLNAGRKYEESLRAAERAIEISPSFASGYRNKGFALSALGRSHEAVEQFELALEREDRPHDRSQILYNKAYTLMLSGDLDLAERAAQDAVQADPMNYKAKALALRMKRTHTDADARRRSTWFGQNTNGL